MARKKKSRARGSSKRSTSAKATRRKGPQKEGPAYRATRGVAQAAMSAAIELGKAAESLKDSFEHVANARNDGKRALKPVRNVGRKIKSVGKKAVRSARRGVARITR